MDENRACFGAVLHSGHPSAAAARAGGARCTAVWTALRQPCVAPAAQPRSATNARAGAADAADVLTRLATAVARGAKAWAAMAYARYKCD